MVYTDCKLKFVFLFIFMPEERNLDIFYIIFFYFCQFPLSNFSGKLKLRDMFKVKLHL